MKTCEEYLEMLSAMLDGELSPADKADLEAHIQNCEDCKAVYGAFEALSQELREPVAVPEGMSESIMDKVRGGKHAWRFNWRRFAAAAACLALVCVSVMHFLPKGALFDNSYMATAMGEIRAAPESGTADSDAAVESGMEYAMKESSAFIAPQAASEILSGTAADATCVNDVVHCASNAVSATLFDGESAYFPTEGEMSELLENLEYSAAAEAPARSPELTLTLSDGSALELWEGEDMICRLDGVAFVPSGSSEKIMELINAIMK